MEILSQRNASPGRYARRSPSRRGAITIEALLVIPLLTIATFAVFQFVGTLAVEQAVSYAATAGAREAAKNATNVEIEAAVEAALAPYQIALGADATAVIERFGSPDVQLGTLALTPAAPALLVGEVRVTVGVDLGAAPLSRLMATFGLDFSTRQYQSSSLARLEL